MNRPVLRLLVPALVLIPAGCGDSGPTSATLKTTRTTAASPASKAEPMTLPDLGPGVHEQTLQDGGKTLRYTIAIPEGYPAKAPVPLILALHYGGDVTPFYGKGVIESLVAPALGDLGAIILAPDSVNGEWNTPENDRAVMLLVESALASYKIDKKKVLVTGYSMGGIGTWYFASKYPDRFTAAVPVAGSPENAVGGPWRTPIFAVHSRKDEIVPIGPTERRIDELRKEGVNAELVAVDDLSHYQTARFVGPLKKAVPWVESLWK